MPRSSERLRAPSWRAGLLLVAAVFCSAGCAPTCSQVCSKLDRCELDPTVTKVECQTACERRITWFREQEDDDGLKVFNDHRRCLGSSSCDEIELGECFEDDLFAIDAE